MYKLTPPAQIISISHRIYPECNRSLDISGISPESKVLDIVEINPDAHIAPSALQYLYDAYRLGEAAGAHFVKTGGITRAIQ